jgi:hypothetical protein
MSSYADILINAIDGLMSPVGIINFLETGGDPGMDNPHDFFAAGDTPAFLLNVPIL